MGGWGVILFDASSWLFASFCLHTEGVGTLK